MLQKQGWIIHAFADHSKYVCGEEKKKKAGVIRGLSCKISCHLGWLHIHPFLCLSPVSTALVEIVCIVVCSLPQPPFLSPSDCNRSSSFSPLSMQAPLHAVHWLTAISKCHCLLPFSCRQKTEHTQVGKTESNEWWQMQRHAIFFFFALQDWLL